MKIVIINWTDSATHGSDNCFADDPRLKPVKAVSIGVLVKEINCETILRRQIEHQKRDIKVMPYETKKVKGGWKNYGPSGEKSKKPLTKKKADAQRRALYANVKD
jgi:hypothetical protein